MITTNKILSIVLVAVLMGGSIGALVMHARNSSAPTAAATTTQTDTAPNATTPVADQSATSEQTFKTAPEQVAYKTGFADGFHAAEAGVSGSQTVTPARVAYRSTDRRVGRASSRRVYYDYPRQRTFWQKHRDKLTVAMGTGAGAAIGGLVGGKKGAGIGALAGAGGSALYTYKLRKRNRSY